MPFTIITQGTFTQPATAVNQIIPLPQSCDYFKTMNLTQLALPTPTATVMSEWYGGGLYADGDGISWTKNGANVVSINSFASAGSLGFTYVNKYPAPSAQLTGLGVTNANPAVVSVVNNYSEGDQVVLYNVVGMNQISGMEFTISSVSGAGFTLLGLDASGFATPGTVFNVRKVAPFPRVAPPFYYVTNITQAAQAVVTVSQKHQYVVGQAVEITVPASMGMVEINNFYQSQNKPLIITAVTDYTFTLDVNSSGYTAFTFPTSAQSPVAQLFATVAPAGQKATYNPTTGVQTGYNFLQVPFRSGEFTPYMLLPTGQFAPAGRANDVIAWQAFKMETGTINAPVPS